VLVFTLTHCPSGRIFVGTTRTLIEERWEQMLEMAMEGREGELMELTRQDGEPAFRLDEWGESDNPGEIRQLVAEAVQDLGAEAIRIAPAVKRRHQGTSLDPEQLKQLLREAEEQDPDIDDPDDAQEDRKETKQPGETPPPVVAQSENVHANDKSDAAVGDRKPRKNESAAARKRRIAEALQR